MSVPKKQKKYYSGKKRKHTLKVEIVVSKSDKKIKRVQIEKGKAHDFKIYKKNPIKLGENKELLADKGYQGVKKIHSQSETPIKKKKGQKLTKEEKKFNREHARERIIVEHINRKIKIFKIFSCRYRNRRKRFGLRINLIVSVINLMTN